MPTYDYECQACDHSLEIFQGINDPVVKKCPQCGKKKMKRLFGSGAAIVFKGSGFYQTDYRSESYKKAAKEENKPSSESKVSESKSSESKSSESKSSPKAKSTPKPGKDS